MNINLKKEHSIRFVKGTKKKVVYQKNKKNTDL